MNVAKIKILRWMCVKIKTNKIERFREYFRVASIRNKYKKNPYEMVWACLMQAKNGADKEKLEYTGC